MKIFLFAVLTLGIFNFSTVAQASSEKKVCTIDTQQEAVTDMDGYCTSEPCTYHTTHFQLNVENDSASPYLYPLTNEGRNMAEAQARQLESSEVCVYIK